MKQRISLGEKLVLLGRQRGRCFYCLRLFYPGEEIHSEHWIAESNGGNEFVLSCGSCNFLKSTREPHLFYIRRLLELSHMSLSDEEITQFILPDKDIKISTYVFSTLNEIILSPERKALRELTYLFDLLTWSKFVNLAENLIHPDLDIELEALDLKRHTAFMNITRLLHFKKYGTFQLFL